MNSASRAAPCDGLPTTRPLALLYICSLLIALIMTAASVAGLVYPACVYPSDVLIQTFAANDVVNLAIGVPILVGSMWLAWRGKLVGLLFWPGALMYVLYNSLAYLFGLPMGWVFMSHLVLVSLSAYTSIGLVASVDGAVVQQRLAGAVPERLSGGVLVGMGLLMLLRALGVVGSALIGQTAVPETELPVLISDFLTSPAVVIGGVLLWQRRALGYVSGVGLLFQNSMLFIGLVAFLLLQPLFSQAPFALIDVIVVSAMGLICFVPFGLFVRGILARKA